MLRNILGPVFNLYLDQFLTYRICYFFVFFWGGAETSIFIVLSAKHAKLKETQKRKKTLFVNTIVLIALVKVSVFSAFLIFAVFFNFRFFKMFLFGFPKSKNTKKQSKQNKKQEQKEDKRCKAKTNEILWFKTKQDNKQNNRNKRTT